MANPSVTNLKPGEGDVFTPTNTLYFSVRDGDTRVNRNSVNSLVTFSKTSYLATALPGSVGSYLDVFNDALPESRPGPNVDRYLNDDISYDYDSDGLDDGTYGPVLVLEKAVAGEDTERGVLFVEADRPSQENTPVGCEIVLGIQSYTRAAGSYFSSSDYVGVVAGFVSWPDNTGVFVFFKEDGSGNRSIYVGGPAEDGVGTRTGAETVVDWSEDINGDSILHAPPAIRVVWDNSRLGKVFVFLTNNSDLTMSVDGGSSTLAKNEELLLFESTITGLGTLQAAARIGNYFSESPPNKLVAFAGINNGSVSDFVEVHSIVVEEFGVFLVGDGNEVSTSSLARSPSDSVVVGTYEDTEAWDRSEVTTQVTRGSTYFNISRDAQVANTSVSIAEADLSSQSFLMVFQGSVRSQEHAGSQSTGIGVDIDDGTALTAFRFLDDFAITRLGVFSDGTASAKTSTSSFHVSPSSWGETTPEILLIGDQTQGFLEMFVSEASDSPVSQVTESAFSAIGAVPYSTVPSSYADPTIAVGFLDEGDALNYGGSFTVYKLIVLPGAEVFLPTKAVGSLPDDFSTWERWNAIVSGSPLVSPVASTADPHWKIESSSNTDYAFFYRAITEPYYLPGESGISLWAKIRLDSWIDQFSGTKSPRIPTCALMAIDIGNDLFVQLQTVLSTSGEQYIFLSQDAQDYIEVLNQTEAGQKISYQVDLSEFHTYMISYRPGKSVDVYIDFSDEPAIHLDWTERSGSHRSSDILSAGMTIAVGAIPLSSPGGTASLTMGMIGVSVGSGFNFEATMSVSDTALQDSIYGASANTFVDVADEDP